MAEKKALSDRAKMEGVLLVAQLDVGQTYEQDPPGSKRQSNGCSCQLLSSCWERNGFLRKSDLFEGAAETLF